MGNNSSKAAEKAEIKVLDKTEVENYVKEHIEIYDNYIHGSNIITMKGVLYYVNPAKQPALYANEDLTSIMFVSDYLEVLRSHYCSYYIIPSLYVVNNNIPYISFGFCPREPKLNNLAPQPMVEGAD